MKAEDILKEAKETVAQNYKYKDWEDLQGHDWPEFFLDEVCLLAMSKVAEQRDNEQIFISTDMPDNVYCAFTDEDRAAEDTTESGVTYKQVTLHRGEKK